MKTFKNITAKIAAMLCGVIITSLLVTDSETWKYALCGILIVITLRMAIIGDE